MKKQIFGLLTDFGNDFAVASIRGVLLKEAPECTIIDIDHTVDKFNLVSAAFIIDKVHPFFPKETVFICIVDPGVGSERQPIYLHANNQHFFGPNNGIFHALLKSNPLSSAFLIDETKFKIASNTFHGRDLFSPAAAAFAHGKRDFLQLIEINQLEILPELDNQTIVSFIDSFGNIKTNIQFPDTPDAKHKTATVVINDISETLPITNTFSAVPEGQLLAYKGSNNTLEIAINLGSAAQFFGAKAGNSVQFNFNNQPNL